MRYAIIPTNGRECLKRAYDAIRPQVDDVVIVNTTRDLEEKHPWVIGECHRVIDTEGINISRWWNRGLRRAERIHDIKTRPTGPVGQLMWDPVQYEVAIINDDAIVPEGWVNAVSNEMRARGAVAGCSGGHDVTLREPVAVPLDMRLQGFAFILAGERGLRANENLHWYFTDDYIDWESRVAGGMSMIRGYPVEHLHPNEQLTPEIHEQIARDAQTFFDLYGRRPW